MSKSLGFSTIAALVAAAATVVVVLTPAAGATTKSHSKHHAVTNHHTKKHGNRHGKAVGKAKPKPPTPTSPNAAATASSIDPTWSAHYTVGVKQLTDSQGRTWQPASGITGGTVSTTDGRIGATGSPQLYKVFRAGIQKWTVRVPEAGRYALDVLVCDTTSSQSGGQRATTVTANGGSATAVLMANLDPVAVGGWWHPYHAANTVDITGNTVTLSFTASKGSTVASGLSIAYVGPTVARQTTLTQDFSGAARSAPSQSVWNYTKGVGWEGTNTKQAYTDSPSNVSLDGAGNLKITALRQDFAGSNGTSKWTSARLNSQNKFTFGYGHISARIKVPGGTGTWPAFWATGATPKVEWPQSGEIDMLEAYGSYPTRASSHIESLGNNSDPRGWHDHPIATLGKDWNSGTTVSQAFHLYASDYEPGYIAFSLDGLTYEVATPEDLQSGEQWPFDGSPNYLQVNLAIGNCTWSGVTPDNGPASYTMLVDYIRVTN